MHTMDACKQVGSAAKLINNHPITHTDCDTGVACTGGVCSGCIPGYYPNATAASGCAECGYGFYCPDGTAHNPCGAGETTTTTTATDATECVPGCTTDAGG